MAIGDFETVAAGSCEDLHYADVGLYDTPEYGSVYVLDAERPAVVETGLGVNHDLILEAMDRVGIAPTDLEVIAVTHVHLDHAGGAGYLAEACPNAEVVVHEIGAPHLADPTRLVEGTREAVGERWAFYAEPMSIPEERLTPVSDGDRVNLGDHALEVHHAPGHAPHQVVFRDPANDAVFTGDAAGIYVPEHDVVAPTTPPVNFDLEQSIADLEAIQALGPETLLYSHFGPAAAGDRLAAYEETLRDWVDAVRQARDRFADDEAVPDHFAEGTDMGDVWGDRQAAIEARLNARGVLLYLDRES